MAEVKLIDNKFGSNLIFSLKGESHSPILDMKIYGLEKGFKIDYDLLLSEMKRRQGGDIISTPRKEADIVLFKSGVDKDYIITGEEVNIVIENNNVRKKDYETSVVRPSHADYSSFIKYGKISTGGGKFSGRLTAPIVALGGIVKQILKKNYDIDIYAHIKQVGDIKDEIFDSLNDTDRYKSLKEKDFPIIDDTKKDLMYDYILSAKEDNDSVGGIIECMAVGVKAGVGEPLYHSIESYLSHLMFSIPSVKGIEFGLGFDFAKYKASEVNDEFYYDENGDVKLKTNNNGGVLGGISVGMPIVFSTVIKPTPSVSKVQNTINIKTKTNEQISIKGRHDPFIAKRAVVVVESMCAIGLYDLLLEGEKNG